MQLDLLFLLHHDLKSQPPLINLSCDQFYRSHDRHMKKAYFKTCNGNAEKSVFSAGFEICVFQIAQDTTSCENTNVFAGVGGSFFKTDMFPFNAFSIYKLQFYICFKFNGNTPIRTYILYLLKIEV